MPKSIYENVGSDNRLCSWQKLLIPIEHDSALRPIVRDLP